MTKYKWFNETSTRIGYTWLIIGLITSISYSISYLTGISKSISIIINNYSINLLFYCMWESFICIGLCIGMVTLFRERVNISNNILNVLAQNTYAVYIIHVLIVVGVQIGLAESTIRPLIKFGIVVLISVPICFVVSQLIRKIPGLRRVL